MAGMSVSRTRSSLWFMRIRHGSLVFIPIAAAIVIGSMESVFLKLLGDPGDTPTWVWFVKPRVSGTDLAPVLASRLRWLTSSGVLVLMCLGAGTILARILLKTMGRIRDGQWCGPVLRPLGRTVVAISAVGAVVVCAGTLAGLQSARWWEFILYLVIRGEPVAPGGWGHARQTGVYQALGLQAVCVAITVAIAASVSALHCLPMRRSARYSTVRSETITRMRNVRVLLTASALVLAAGVYEVSCLYRWAASAIPKSEPVLRQAGFDFAAELTIAAGLGYSMLLAVLYGVPLAAFGVRLNRFGGRERRRRLVRFHWVGRIRSHGAAALPPIVARIITIFLPILTGLLQNAFGR